MILRTFGLLSRSLSCLHSKGINLTTGIGTHTSHVILRPLDELVALTGRQLSAYRSYEPNYVRLVVNPLNHNFVFLTHFSRAWGI